MWGYWPDWAPGWWADSCVWLTDLVMVDGAPAIVAWVDTCCGLGPIALPEIWDGYRVHVVPTCGTELVDSGLGAMPSVSDALKEPGAKWMLGGAAAGAVLGALLTRSALGTLAFAAGGAAGGIYASRI